MAARWSPTAVGLAAVVAVGCGGDGGTGPGEETQGATVTVGVTTDGDPAPATSYTVRANGSMTRSVSANGSVTFTGLPPGSAQVALEGLPVHCTVTGSSPRTVNAPGQTTFEVVCEPVVCGEPPGDSFLDSGSDATPGEGGSGTAQILSNEWNEASVRVTSTAPLDGLGPEQHAESRAYDHVFLQPVNPSRVGEEVQVNVHVEGRLVVTPTPHAVTLPWGYVTFDENVIFEIPGFQMANPVAGALEIDEVVSFEVLLGSWRVLEVFAAATATARDLTSTTVTATLRVDSIVDVRDGTGELVPIQTVCTESETEY